MSTLDLIRAILHGADFYWKKFFVFCLMLFIVGGGFWYWQSQNKSEADYAFSDTPKYQSVYQDDYIINVSDKGKVTVNGKKDSKALKIYPDYYEVRVMALDKPGKFISNFEATINLPAPVAKDQVQQKMYAVHGVEKYSTTMSDSKTLVFTAQNVSSSATVTVAAYLPKSILKPPLTKLIVYKITNVSSQNYFIIAGILPLLTLIIMFAMVIIRRSDRIIASRIAPNPDLPDDSPPALVGTLVDGRVSSREIAATIIDLAMRGYVYITTKGYTFSFGQRKNLNLEKDPNLKLFERHILSKIFQPGGYRSTRDDVETRVGGHIFSRKIAEAYLEIYNEATRRGYFVQNPAVVHLRWKFAGIALSFLGLLGFIHSVFYAPDPKFTLIFWAGEVAAAAVIVKLSAMMPARSKLGSKTMANWLAFRKYLKINKPIEPQNRDKFITYLPYALVMGVEADWAKRFLNDRFVRPDWFESIDFEITFSSFIGELYPLIGFVGTILAGSHEPTVE